MASPGKAADDVGSEADAAEDETEMPPMKVPRGKFQQLLLSARSADMEPEERGEPTATAPRPVRKARVASAKAKFNRALEFQRGHEIGESARETAPCAAGAGSR